MTKEQIKYLRQSYYVSMEHPRQKQAASSVQWIFDNTVVFRDHNDFVVFDDEHELIYCIAANANTPVKNQCPFSVNATAYEHLQFVEANLTFDGLMKLLDTMFASSVTGDAKDFLIKWAKNLPCFMPLDPTLGDYHQESAPSVPQIPSNVEMYPIRSTEKEDPTFGIPGIEDNGLRADSEDTRVKLTIGGKSAYFETLGEAIEASGGNSTIKLLNTEGALAEKEMITIDKPITLDLNKQELSRNDSDLEIFRVMGGSLTLKNGTVTNANNKMSSKAINVIDGALTIERDAKVVCTNGYGITTLPVGEGSVTADIYGEVDGFTYGIGGNASKTKYNGKTILNVYGGAHIKSVGTSALYYPNGNDIINIYGGIIEGITGISIRGGTLNIFGGHIIGDYSFNNKYYGFSHDVTGVNNGNTIYGVGIAISRHSTGDSIKVNISGNPVIEGYYPICEHDMPGDYTGNVSIKISGDPRILVNSLKEDGTPKEATPDTTAGRVNISTAGDLFLRPDEEGFSSIVSQHVTNFVSGGIFNVELNESFIAEGYKQDENLEVVKDK